MIIAIANQKGGVSKTTTSATLGQGLQQLYKKSVLFIDLDPQGNLSYHLGADTENSLTIADTLAGTHTAEQTIQKANQWHIIPSDQATSTYQNNLQAGELKRLLEPIKNKYDFIIIDTPPTLSALTINAFISADRVIIPTNAGIYATQGIQQLYEVIEHSKKYNKSIIIDGILLTKYSDRSIIHKQLKQALTTLAGNLNTKVYKSTIRQAIAIEESQATKQSIFDYAKRASVTDDYKRFIKEFMKEV